MRPDVRPPKSHRVDIIKAMRRGGDGSASPLSMLAPADSTEGGVVARNPRDVSPQIDEGSGTGLAAGLDTQPQPQGLTLSDPAGGVLEAFAAAELIGQAGGDASQGSTPVPARSPGKGASASDHPPGLLWQLSPGLFYQPGAAAASAEVRPHHDVEHAAAAEVSDGVASGEESRAAGPVQNSIRHAQSRLLQRGSQRAVLLPPTRSHLRDLVVRASSRNLLSPRSARSSTPAALPLWKKLG